MKFPLKFEDLESVLIKQNRLLKAYGMSVALAMALLSFLVIGQRSYFVFSGGQIFKERALLEDVCKESFIEIAQKKMSRLLIHEELIELIEKSEMSWGDGEILKLSTPKVGECRIVTKGDHGPRAYKLSFASQDDFPFFYRLIEMTEIEEEK